MRVQYKVSGLGPARFVKRLMNYLSEHYDVDIVDSDPDIYFSSVWGGNPPKKAKHIHRADGCYFNTKNNGIARMNRRIAQAIDHANIAVFQSKYSYKICKKIAGAKQKNCRVIYNGFDESVYDNLEVNKRGYDKLIIASADWRALKRPLAIAQGFLKAKLDNAGLFMIGPIDNKWKVKNKNIKYVGNKSPEKVYKFCKSCDAIIHISKLDACPNSVVEALAAGKPCICNNIGGTPELVGEDGVIVKIDKPFDYKPFAMRNVNAVNIDRIARGIRECLNKEWNINREDLTMSYCAKQYYDLFVEVLS